MKALHEKFGNKVAKNIRSSIKKVEVYIHYRDVIITHDGFCFQFATYDNESIWLNGVEVYPEYRGQGIGHIIMDAIADVSDEMGVVVYLQPENFCKNLSLKALVKFYLSHGFHYLGINPFAIIRMGVYAYVPNLIPKAVRK